MNPKISINICTKDRVTELTLLLQSLRNQTYKDFDIIIVDESQTPLFNYHFFNSMVMRLKLEGHNVIVKRSMSPGVVANRNQAIKLSETEYCLRIDDDSICDKNYVEKLYNLIKKSKKTGATGGVVPMFGDADFVRNSNLLTIFDEIRFNNEGDITKLTDNGGFQWQPYKILPTHHLRSSFIFRKKAAEEVKLFSAEYQGSAFREETDFCLKLAYKKYKMFTDTGAICWHLRAPSGGLRTPDYLQSLQICEQHFREKFKKKYKKLGDPFAEKK